MNHQQQNIARPDKCYFIPENLLKSHQMPRIINLYADTSRIDINFHSNNPEGDIFTIFLYIFVFIVLVSYIYNVCKDI